MKKFVSVVLALTMVVSMFATASAATVATTTSWVPNPLELGLEVVVKGRESGIGGDYTTALAIASSELLGADSPERIKGVDYQTTLNMKPIRDLFGEDFMTTTLLNDPDVATEFNSGIVSTTVKVVIDYPATAIVKTDLASAGILDAGSIFSQVSRDVNGNKVTIIYKNEDNLTAEELMDNKDAYLKDISFTLNDAIAYSAEGNHTVSVTLSGSTKIAFSSKTQEVTYTGSSSHITTYTLKPEDIVHILEIVPRKPATCTEVGYTEGVRCLTCADPYDANCAGTHRPEEIAKLNHVGFVVDIAEVPATCGSIGIKAHKMCLLCKQDFIGTTEVTHDSLIIPATGAHTEEPFGNVIVANCKTQGLTTGKKCSVCGLVTKKQETTAFGPHTPTTVQGKAATCTEDGMSNGSKCSVCNAEITPQTVIPATGHSYADNWVTVGNYKERTCQNGCGTKDRVEIKPAHSHSVDPSMDLITQIATCTTTGLKQERCSCGEIVNADVVIPINAAAHNLTHVKGYAETCVSTGITEHYHCELCDKYFRDKAATNELASPVVDINKSKHGGNIVSIPAIESTCTKYGFTGGTMCSACGLIKDAPTLLTILGDHENEFIAEQAPDCETNGVKAHDHCKVCNADFVAGKQVTVNDLLIPAIGHKYGVINVTTEPTVDAEGEGTQTCEHSNCPNPTKTVKIAKKQQVGDTHNGALIEVKTLVETCTTSGKAIKKYSCCGETYGEEYEIPPHEHMLKEVPRVESCIKIGHEAYFECLECGKKFDREDRTKEITEVKPVSKRPHKFKKLGNKNVCEYEDCQEIVEIDVQGDAEVLNHDGIKDDKDRSINADVKSKITVKPREEISKELDDKIPEQAGNKKASFDITVEKITTYGDTTTRTEVKSTEEFVEIQIPIPPTMRGEEDYHVYRYHDGEHTKNDILSRTLNAYDEHITDIASDNIKLKVKRFSEYAIVTYDEQQPPIVYPDPNPAPSTGGGGSSSVTIKLNANGGTLLNNVTVKRGTVATLPTPVRDGYVFAGWYTDSNFTTPFDATKPVNRNYTLYAKWVELGECEGTIEDNCPCLKFYDLDPTMWYHRGVDYVLNRGMMNGVATTQFAPDWDVTRAMLVTVLWRAEGKPAGADTTFTDLEDGLYYVDAVKWAAANGVVNGYSDTVFAPNDAITREQFAAIMYRYAKNKGYDVTAGENTNILSYSDYDAISEYAIEAMQYTLGSGLIKGRTETTLNPKDNTTRAEMATILYRFFTEGK